MENEKLTELAIILAETVRNLSDVLRDMSSDDPFKGLLDNDENYVDDSPLPPADLKE